MKLVSKLALLGCASTCLVGMVQADDGINFVQFVDVPTLSNVACGGGNRTVDYDIINNGPTTVNLVIELEDISSDDAHIGTVSCSTDITDEGVEGVLASGDTCHIQLVITPDTVCSNNAIFPTTDGRLEIDINTRQRELSTPIFFQTTALGAAADFAVLSSGTVDSVDGSSSPVTSQVDNGDVGAEISVSPNVIVLSGMEFVGNIPVVNNALSDAESAFDRLQTLPCTTIAAGTLPTILTPGVYCSTAGIVLTGNHTIVGTEDEFFIFRFDGAGTLTTNSTTNVGLSGGMLPENVIWAFNNVGTFNPLDGIRFTGTVISNGNIGLLTDVIPSPAVFGSLISVTSTSNDINLGGGSVTHP